MCCRREMTLVEYVKGAKARLKWKPPGSNRTDAIPADYFFHEVPKLGSMGPFARLVNGLKAEYFADAGCRRLVATGAIESLDFNLGDSPPCTRCGRDRPIRSNAWTTSTWTFPF